MEPDRHGGLDDIGGAEREREVNITTFSEIDKSNLAASSSEGLVRLFLDSFLGTLFLLDTTGPGPDTELDFFLGVALPAPGGVEPVPAGHYNAILKLELPSLATLTASTKAIIIIIITFYTNHHRPRTQVSNIISYFNSYRSALDNPKPLYS